MIQPVYCFIDYAQCIIYIKCIYEIYVIKYMHLENLKENCDVRVPPPGQIQCSNTDAVSLLYSQRRALYSLTLFL